MKIRLLLLLIVCAFASSAVVQSLFVAARYSNTLAAINTATDQIHAQITVGAFPIRVAMTPDRSKAYISNAQSASISVINTTSGATLGTIPVSPIPGESQVTPDGGKFLRLASSWSPWKLPGRRD